MEIANVYELKQLSTILKNDESVTEQTKEMYFAMGKQEKIRAIKLHRQLTGDDSGTSKDFVEDEMKRFEQTYSTKL